MVTELIQMLIDKVDYLGMNLIHDSEETEAFCELRDMRKLVDKVKA